MLVRKFFVVVNFGSLHVVRFYAWIDILV